MIYQQNTQPTSGYRMGCYDPISIVILLAKNVEDIVISQDEYRAYKKCRNIYSKNQFNLINRDFSNNQFETKHKFSSI